MEIHGLKGLSFYVLVIFLACAIFYSVVGWEELIRDHFNHRATECRLTSMEYSNTSKKCSYCVSDDRCFAPCLVITVDYFTHDGKLQTSILYPAPSFSVEAALARVSVQMDLVVYRLNKRKYISIANRSAFHQVETNRNGK